MPDSLATIPRLPITAIRPRGGNFCCRICRHYQPNPVDPQNLKAEPQGMCHRYPPVPGLAGMQNTPAGPVPVVVALLPAVHPTFYCGEFSSRPKGDGFDS